MSDTSGLQWLGKKVYDIDAIGFNFRPIFAASAIANAGYSQTAVWCGFLQKRASAQAITAVVDVSILCVVEDQGKRATYGRKNVYDLLCRLLSGFLC